MPSVESNIPLEAVLKLAVEQAGGEQVKGFLESYTLKLKEGEESVSRTNSTLREMADHVGRLGDSFKSVGGMLGIAGAGAVAQQFMAISGAGANVAMAEGHLTGGSATYGAYANALLGVQAQTGVPYTQLEEGLRTAAQMAGGNLSPQGAARFGSLIAGISLTSGMSPAATASVLGSFMESANMTSNYGTTQGVSDVTGLMAGVSQALSAFPGYQAGGMLPTVYSVYEAQALRSGPGGPHEAPAQTAGFVNALAQANPLFRNAQTVQGAIEGGNAFLMGGLTNPKLAMAEQMSGISVNQMIEGGPETLERFATSMHSMLPTETTFRAYLHSVMPASTAKMMEEVVHHPGLMVKEHRRALEAAVKPNVSRYLEEIKNPLPAQTPEHELLKMAAPLLEAIEGAEVTLGHAITPGGAALATVAGGALVGRLGLNAARATAGGIQGFALDNLGDLVGGSLPAGLVAYAAGAGEAIHAQPNLASAIKTPQLEALRRIPGIGAVASGFEAPEKFIGGLVSGGIEGWGHLLFGNKTRGEQQAAYEHVQRQQEEARFHALYSLHSPFGVGAGHPNVSKGALSGLIGRATELAEKHFGTDEWQRKPGAQRYLDELLRAQAEPGFLAGWAEHHLSLKEEEGGGLQRLSQALIKPANSLLSEEKKYQELGPEGYWQSKFGESVGKFDEAVEKMLHGSSGHKNTGTGYEGGAGQHNASYNPVSPALATNPGAVLAAWMRASTLAPTAIPTGLPNPLGPHNENIDYVTGLEGSVSGWQKLINQAARPNVPAALIAAVMTQESGGKPNALSSAGAEGLMQLMPSTAKGLGVKNPLNPRENVMGGARLLGELLGQYHGNLHEALEAYNGGPGGVGGNAEKLYANSVEAILRKIDQGIKQMNRHQKRSWA